LFYPEIPYTGEIVILYLTLRQWYTNLVKDASQQKTSMKVEVTNVETKEVTILD